MKNLTNEQITKESDNLFDLVNYAIELAKTLIHTGRECRVKTDVHNPAYEALLEIASGKDSLDPLESDIKRQDMIEPANA